MLQHAIKNTLAKLDRVKIRGTVERAHVVGPDEEAERWARVMAEELGTEYAILEKKRLSAAFPAPLQLLRFPTRPLRDLCRISQREPLKPLQAL